MSYSVMTSEAWLFDAVVLREAFGGVGQLTQKDAEFAARHYEGIVAEGLDPESAFLLQGAMRARGVETKVVDEAELPGLGDAIRVKRVKLTETGLSVAGLLGAETQIEWDGVDVVCLAGMTKTRVSAGVGGVETGLEQDPGGAAGPSLLAEPMRMSKSSVTWTVELYTHDGKRYSLEKEDVLLNDASLAGLGKRDERFENMARLVAHNATRAATNHRLDQLVGSNLASVKPYVNRVARDREAVWLLWYMNGARGF